MVYKGLVGTFFFPFSEKFECGAPDSKSMLDARCDSVTVRMPKLHGATAVKPDEVTADDALCCIQSHSFHSTEPLFRYHRGGSRAFVGKSQLNLASTQRS